MVDGWFIPLLTGFSPSKVMQANVTPRSQALKIYRELGDKAMEGRFGWPCEIGHFGRGNYPKRASIQVWLVDVGGLGHGFCFPIQLGIGTPSDFHILQRGRHTTNQ